jgi:hypothetical protein
VRNELEIVYAHDLFSLALIQPDLRRKVFGVYDGAIERACLMVDVLCWVLGHDHNPGFPDILAHVERKLADLGIEIIAAKGAPDHVH